MKKLVLLMAVAGLFAASCTENKTEDTATTVDTSMNPAGDMTVTETTTTTTTYTPAEGDVKRENGNVVVYRSGAWTPVTENEVVMDNGTVVTKTGEVRNSEGKVVVIHDGEAVTKTGRFFDKAGNAMENAWDQTKEGAKEAANAVERGLNNAADKVHDATHKDEKK